MVDLVLIDILAMDTSASAPADSQAEIVKLRSLQGSVK